MVLPVESAAPTAPALRATPTPAASSAEPSADDRALAERYFTEARAMLNANRVAEACELFQKSLKAAVAIGTMFNLAATGQVERSCGANPCGADRAKLAKQRATNLGCR